MKFEVRKSSKYPLIKSPILFLRPEMYKVEDLQFLSIQSALGVV
jgi:hypothetical protein